MRPDILFPLFAPVTTLKGLGPKLGKLTEKLVGTHVADLLWHLPTGIIDRRFAPHVAEAPDGFIATLTVRVEYHSAPANPRHPYKVRCSDESGQIDLIFFHARGDWLVKQLPVGDTVVVSGKVEYRQTGVRELTRDPKDGTTTYSVTGETKLTFGGGVDVKHVKVDASWLSGQRTVNTITVPKGTDVTKIDPSKPAAWPEGTRVMIKSAPT